MSRYNQHRNAWCGIATWLMNFDQKIDADKEINAYSKDVKLKGDFTERCLLISSKFNEFKKYIREKYAVAK